MPLGVLRSLQQFFPAPRRQVFGIHIPKTAGTSFLAMSRETFGASLFQNTSQTANFEAGMSSDIFSLRAPENIRMIFGHHVYETTLQFFRPHADELATLTFMREPLARLRSQFAFDVRLNASLSLPAPSEGEFIERTSDSVCKFLVERFPSLAGPVGSLAERALKVLSAFDLVLPHTDFVRGLEFAQSQLSGTRPRRQVPVGHHNKSDHGTGTLEASDDTLRAHNQEDLHLYELLKQARRRSPSSPNPVSRSAARRALREIARQPFDARRHIAHVGKSLALELVLAKGAQSVTQHCRGQQGMERELLEAGLQELGINI